MCFFFFFFNDTATTEIYTLSLHDALPISRGALSAAPRGRRGWRAGRRGGPAARSDGDRRALLDLRAPGAARRGARRRGSRRGSLRPIGGGAPAPRGGTPPRGAPPGLPPRKEQLRTSRPPPPRP